MEYNYVITASYDGELFGTYRLPNFDEAVEAWNKFVDTGDAKEYATYSLTDPIGHETTKTFYVKG